MEKERQALVTQESSQGAKSANNGSQQSTPSLTLCIVTFGQFNRVSWMVKQTLQTETHTMKLHMVVTYWLMWNILSSWKRLTWNTRMFGKENLMIFTPSTLHTKTTFCMIQLRL